MLQGFLLAFVAAMIIVPLLKLALRRARRGDEYLFALSLLLSLGLNVFLVLLPALAQGGPAYMAFSFVVAEMIAVVGVALGSLLTALVLR